MDLTVIYSKTSKGSRLRSSLFGGPSSSLKKVLALVDGKSNVRQILAKLNDVSEQKLTLDLTQLENDGYIKQVTLTVSEDWLRVSIFSPMVVEEFNHIQEIEAKAERDLKLEAEQKARARMEDELQAREVVEQIRAKEKAKAEEKSRIEVERKAKHQAELQKAAELKMLEDAKKNRIAEQAEQKAKAEEKARTAEIARVEKERIFREQDELQKKTEAESLAFVQEKNRLEAESRHKAVLSVLKALEDAEQNRIKAETEEKARAEELARLESENFVREQEEIRKNSEAETLAKAEEVARMEKERIAREQEEIRKNSEAETLAKAAEKSRLAAERKAKQQAEIRQKAEIKAREALEKIRDKEQTAEQEARKKSEEEARSKAEENARLEAEYIAQQEAEEVRLKIEVAAREAAENARIKAEAEEKAKADELKRIEIERNMREAEEILKQSEAKARDKILEEARLEEKRIAREKTDAETKLKAEVKSKKKADEKALKEAERVAKKEALAIQEKIRQESNKRELAEAQRLVAAVENEKLKVSAPVKITAKTISLGRWIQVVIKAVLVYLPLLVLILVGLLHVINLSFLVNPIQKLASETLGEQVVVHEVHASLWPEPHLTLNAVELGASSDFKMESLKIESVDISPDISTLSENVKVLESLKFSGVNLESGNAHRVLQWANSLSKAAHLKIKRINFNQVNFQILDLTLEPFEGEIALDESRGLTNINMKSPDNGLLIQLSPHGDDFNITITATRWPLPFNSKVVFEDLIARGTLNADLLNLNQIDGSIYGGNLTARAIVRWTNQWEAAGSFSLSNASTPQLLKVFASDGAVEGKLNLTGSFTGTSNSAATLAGESEVTSNFEIRNGKINGIDLERAVLFSGDKSLAGDATDFKKLAGTLKIKDGLFQYKKLLLQAPQLQVQGNLDIQPNQDISGNISASLAAQSRRLQAKFDLTGKVNNVKQR
jgi:hypothetical protein